MLARILRFFRSSTFIMGAIGGGIFLVVFFLQLQSIDPAKYEYRDDGIITLSHAKNFIDHGHIGVDPSGKRLEGFSAPTQFWIYTAVYGLTRLHWLDFGTFQTILCTFLLGFFFIQFFRRQYFTGVLLTALAAWFMTWHYRFIEWHASGMENAWTHLLFLLAVYLMGRMVERGKINFWWIIWIFFAAISRTESVFHITPLLLLGAGWYRSRHQSWRGLHFAVGVGLVWGLYQAWRIFYFGSFFPNTGLAQEISVRDNLVRIWDGDEAWLRLTTQWAREIWQRHGVWMLAPLLMALPFLKERNRWIWPVLALFSLALTAFLNPVVFGMTRLDVTRSTTFLVPLVALGLALGLQNLSLRGARWLALPLLLATIVFGRLLRPLALEPPRHLCCGVDNFTEKAYFADQFASENNLHRLQFANPDLGKLSYLKRFNLTDLGFLGSPVLARLRHDDYLTRNWFYDFIRPDIVEVHGEWCVLHGRLLSDRRFRETYTPLQETRAGYLDELGGAYPDIGEGVFVRKALKNGSGNKEKQLIEAVKSRENGRAEYLRQAFALAQNPDRPQDHEYVVRTAYRFLPELEAEGEMERLLDDLEKGPAGPVDVALLRSGHRGNWATDIVDWLEDHRAEVDADPVTKFFGHPGKLLIERDRWRFYALPGNRLVGALLAPLSEELQAEFILHAFAADKENALKKNPWGADFMDYRWDPACAHEWNGEFFWEMTLPPEALEAIIVGQGGPEGDLWRERAEWPSHLEK